MRAIDKIGYVSNVYIAGVMCTVIHEVTGRPVQYCLGNEHLIPADTPIGRYLHTAFTGVGGSGEMYRVTDRQVFKFRRRHRLMSRNFVHKTYYALDLVLPELGEFLSFLGHMHRLRPGSAHRV